MQSRAAPLRIHAFVYTPVHTYTGCSTHMVGDGTCNKECMTSACNFDARDCECTNVIDEGDPRQRIESTPHVGTLEPMAQLIVCVILRYRLGLPYRRLLRECGLRRRHQALLAHSAEARRCDLDPAFISSFRSRGRILLCPRVRRAQQRCTSALSAATHRYIILPSAPLHS